MTTNDYCIIRTFLATVGFWKVVWVFHVVILQYMVTRRAHACWEGGGRWGEGGVELVVF